ncbi:DinB family protein [Amphibacillus sediminis]|uniref:DinB family protein n=1 Tax=Amphibacillus sediminis TaxID=360185 RepID=UPI000833672B|nr:DinB family protein [Amphibacillus sediminis]
MNVNDLIILNFEEIRRRSIKVWTSIPDKVLEWRPDSEAMTCQDMIRHVLEGEYLYHQILENQMHSPIKNFYNPYQSKPFTTVEEELAFAQPYRQKFLSFVKSLSNEELKDILIDRSDVGYIRPLGDMLLRIAYHESVHTGQLLDYLRTAQVRRPNIWD